MAEIDADEIGIENTTGRPIAVIDTVTLVDSEPENARWR